MYLVRGRARARVRVRARARARVRARVRVRVSEGGCPMYLAPSVADMNIAIAVVTRSGRIARSSSSRCSAVRLRSQSPTMGPPPPGSVPT